MTQPTLRKPYHQTDRSVSALKLSQEGGADQAARASTNINTIVSQYQNTGTVNHINRREPLHGDFSDAADLHTQIERVMDAQANFDDLPSNVRAAAANDPVQFLAMCEDPKALAFLVENGLEIEDIPVEENPPSPPKPATKKVAKKDTPVSDNAESESEA